MNHFCSELDKPARHRGRHDISGFWSTKTCQFPLMHFWMYLLNQLKISDNTGYSILHINAPPLHLPQVALAHCNSTFSLAKRRCFWRRCQLRSCMSFDFLIGFIVSYHQHASVSFLLPSPIIVLIMRHTCIRIALIFHLYLGCCPQLHLLIFFSPPALLKLAIWTNSVIRY